MIASFFFIINPKNANTDCCELIIVPSSVSVDEPLLMAAGFPSSSSDKKKNYAW